MTRITINGHSFDPPRERPGERAAADASHSDYVLVQVDGLLTGRRKAELSGLGAEILEYVPDDAYLCRYRPADLDALRALPYVSWADVYQPHLKIEPVSPGGPPGSRLRPRAGPVEVVFHAGVDPAASGLAGRLAAIASQASDPPRMSAHKARLTVTEDGLAELAALDEVRLIRPVPRYGPHNNVARCVLNADVLIADTVYQGEGQVVGVVDTGFDKGSTIDVHPAFTGRVARLYALGRPDNADDPHGHGTHVSGSILGSVNSPMSGGLIEGTAPRARLVLQSVIDEDGDWSGLPDDLRELYTPVYYADGVRVHSNSWGLTESGLRYDQSSWEIDDFIWRHPDMVICFSAGNSGADADSDGVVDPGQLGDTAAAKNSITVGASENVRPDIDRTYRDIYPKEFPAEPIRSDRVADAAHGMAAFSSRGPTKEGRYKPDVVAPGTAVLSARSRILPPNPGSLSRDPLLTFMNGTSMSCPLVAGCAAVVRESLLKNGTPDPTAALIKALLINGAVELTGQYAPTEAGTSPNSNSGFGRVDLARSVIVPGRTPHAGFHQGDPLEQQREHALSIDVPASGTLKVTLVWTDPPGAGLQNDLDLIVRAGDGSERHGNMGASDGFDRHNNVEQVWWTGVPTGQATLTVRAHRITVHPQPYAVVWRVT
ncbi:S8 family serine peptidase [Actinomadura sp. ATCC 31491]|uniref:S8 family serine peptidase n=1 Tax=Actinomadura luzonensis TaxID=2805427 RepID=A0ABT0FMZ5_9ACTN|nr:S8 family serine peptidase [Actinomadura luzonensis]MCK2213709.1 S8 family serine peptidase [Actinomadura luzonensis]